MFMSYSNITLTGPGMISSQIYICFTRNSRNLKPTQGAILLNKIINTSGRLINNESINKESNALNK